MNRPIHKLQRSGSKVSSRTARAISVANYKLCESDDAGSEFFVAQIPFTKGGVKYREVRDGEDGPLIDILDVKIEGYASTFNNLDRDGERFLPGAFEESIPDFMKNPVMLKDHWNKCDNVVGKFTDVEEDKKGLFVRGILSNAPDVRGIRFRVAEGMIRTFSVAGMFHFNESHIEIFKAHLWEISLIPIPANPKALFDFIKGQKVSDDNAGDKNRIMSGSSTPPKSDDRPKYISVAGMRVIL